MLFIAMCVLSIGVIGALSDGQAKARNKSNVVNTQLLKGTVILLQEKVMNNEKEVEKLKGQLKKVKVQQEQTQTDLATLQASLHKQAAFSVTFDMVSQMKLDIGTGGTIRFDKIVTNIAGGYNPEDGRFTAPFAGVYAFFCSLRSINDRDWVVIDIVKGDIWLAQATGNGLNTPWDTGTAFATTHLDKGEQVFVKQHPGKGGSFVERGSLTTFSGMLVTAD
ncbi:complement C1q-like protein 4 [Littorina saxatilis]|uniref:C1q domain-containing protein n=1 Tax=Littorina saxatilis TaxID=31220 RepID=A0AAN9GK34_9CAEN